MDIPQHWRLNITRNKVNNENKKRKEIPVGIFNAKKTNNPRRTESPDSGCGGHFDNTNYRLRCKAKTGDGGVS